MSQADDLTALLVDASDATPHGKCNAVYVGFEPSTEQAAALSAYSAQFKVCTRSWRARKKLKLSACVLLLPTVQSTRPCEKTQLKSQQLLLLLFLMFHFLSAGVQEGW